VARGVVTNYTESPSNAHCFGMGQCLLHDTCYGKLMVLLDPARLQRTDLSSTIRVARGSTAPVCGSGRSGLEDAGARVHRRLLPEGKVYHVKVPARQCLAGLCWDNAGQLLVNSALGRFCRRAACRRIRIAGSTFLLDHPGQPGSSLYIS